MSRPRLLPPPAPDPVSVARLALADQALQDRSHSERLLARSHQAFKFDLGWIDAAYLEPEYSDQDWAGLMGILDRSTRGASAQA